MTTRRVADVFIEVERGDITSQHDFDAVVNAANAQLAPGGGVAGAIHRAAGPGLHEACLPLAPIRTGEAVITLAFDLPNRYCIHALGPVHDRSDDPAGELARCYREALLRADESDLASLAFPAISTGAFGYPIEEAAEVSLRAVIEEAPKLASVRRVRFVLYSDADREVFERTLERLTDEP